MGIFKSQFYDLLNILNIGNFEINPNFIFLGDYVDRGPHSLETITLLFILKLKYPRNIYLLRGNHESKNLNQTYGFMSEIQFKLNDLKIWHYFIETFYSLPLAIVLNNNYFLVHGGISPSFEYLGDLNTVDRYVEIENEGIVQDLLWSDPDNIKYFAISPRFYN